MISKYINLSKQTPELVKLSGNYNYGLFCGIKDTINKGENFVYELLEKYGITDEKYGKGTVKQILTDFRKHCEHENRNI